MRATEIRQLPTGQFEIDVVKDAREYKGLGPDYSTVEKTMTYRSNMQVPGSSETLPCAFMWARLPDVIVVDGEELTMQLNVWLYDWLQQQQPSAWLYDWLQQRETVDSGKES